MVRVASSTDRMKELFLSFTVELFQQSQTFTQDITTWKNVEKNNIYFIISGRVNFPDFKERFVQVLSTSMTEDLTQGEDGDTDLESDTEYTYSSRHHGKLPFTLQKILVEEN